MNKKGILGLIFLVLFSSIVIAGLNKIPIYNPFGRHLQYIATGFDGTLTKDIIWNAEGTTTTLNTSFNGTANSTWLNTIYLVENLTKLNFPTSGILIIGTEAIPYYNYTLSSNYSATNWTAVSIEKRGAYGTTNVSHTAADNVYFTKFLIGTDNSTAPLLAINSNGYTGFKNIAPSVELEVDGNITGDLNWSNLFGYPAACPTGSAITTLDDSTTCTEFALLDSGSNTGHLNLSGYNITVDCMIMDSGGTICSS